MKDNDYSESSYSSGASQRAGAMVKSMTIFCLSLLIIAGTFLFYLNYSDRFVMMTAGDGLYVFDRKESNLNRCDAKDKNCYSMALAKSPAELAMMQSMVNQSMMGGGIMPSLGLGGGQQGGMGVPNMMSSGFGPAIPQGTPSGMMQNQWQAGQQAANMQMGPNPAMMQQQQAMMQQRAALARGQQQNVRTAGFNAGGYNNQNQGNNNQGDSGNSDNGDDTGDDGGNDDGNNDDGGDGNDDGDDGDNN